MARNAISVSKFLVYSVNTNVPILFLVAVLDDIRDTLCYIIPLCSCLKWVSKYTMFLQKRMTTQKLFLNNNFLKYFGKHQKFTLKSVESQNYRSLTIASYNLCILYV